MQVYLLQRTSLCRPLCLLSDDPTYITGTQAYPTGCAAAESIKSNPPNRFPYGLAARIPGFHPGGSGSTPGMGISLS